MNCNSKNCKYYMYDECIRKNVVIERGVCPYYDDSHELVSGDIFKSPVYNMWQMKTENGVIYYASGHLLEVCASHYWDADYLIVSPYDNHGLSHKEVYENLAYSFTKDVYDMNLYLHFIGSNINSMYIESFLQIYLENEKFLIEKLDCSNQFVHIIIRRKG